MAGLEWREGRGQLRAYQPFTVMPNQVYLACSLNLCQQRKLDICKLGGGGTNTMWVARVGYRCAHHEVPRINGADQQEGDVRNGGHAHQQAERKQQVERARARMSAELLEKIRKFAETGELPGKRGVQLTGGFDMLSSQEDQAERRRVLANDARVREQQNSSSFFHQTHIDDAGGRFAAVHAASVVGADPIPKYPAAAAHQSDPCGPEPPLGYRIGAMPDLESSTIISACPVETSGPADAPSSPLMSERAGPFLSNKRGFRRF